MPDHDTAERIGTIVIISLLLCAGVSFICFSLAVCNLVTWLTYFIRRCCTCCKWCMSDNEGDVINPAAYAEYEVICPCCEEP